MLLLLVLSAAAAPTPVTQIQAKAAVRIQRPTIASRLEWERLPESRRKEVVRHDDQGRPILIRLIEHE